MFAVNGWFEEGLLGEEFNGFLPPVYDLSVTEGVPANGTAATSAVVSASPGGHTSHGCRSVNKRGADANVTMFVCCTEDGNVPLLVLVPIVPLY